MPCNYRILQSPPKGQVLLVLWETVGRSQIAKASILEGLQHRGLLSKYVVLPTAYELRQKSQRRRT